MALFVGTVVDVFPKSMEHYFDLMQGFPGLEGTGPPRKEGQPAQKAAPGSREKFEENLKMFFLSVWRETLTPAEVVRVLAAKDQTELGGILGDWVWPRRVRLRVTEEFVGTDGGVFELFTGVGGGDCGSDFVVGESYLVEALMTGRGRWTSNICSRTRHVRSAASDLAALRAWKNGEQSASKVYGQVVDWTDRGILPRPLPRPIGGVRVRLLGAEQRVEVVTDAEGRFSFDNLSPHRFHLEVTQPGWTASSVSGWDKEIGLRRRGCAEVWVPLVEKSSP